MIERALRRPRMVLVAIAVATAFVGAGNRGLFETTEGRYAECAREMLETGNWLVPQLDYRPHWTKPPLTYWALAVAVSAGGRNAWSVRAVGALAFVLTVWFVGETARMAFGPAEGFLAALVYATSPFSLAGASVVSTDMMLALASAAVVWAYWKARFAPPDRERRWILGMWVAAGLGFLTKGPPALLVLLSVIGFHALEARRDARRPRLHFGWGLVLFAVTGLTWYVAVVVRHSGLLAYFVGDEVVGRIFTPQFHRNPQWYGPLTMYAGPLLVGSGLWLLLLPFAWRRRARGRTDAPEAPTRGGPGVRFALTWLGLTVVILSISRSRLTLYVLPVFAAVVFLIARALVPLTVSAGGRRAVAAVALLTVGLTAVGRHEAARRSSGRDMLPLYRACVAAGGSDPAVFLVSGDRLYGLLFYLDGRAARVITGAQNAPAGSEAEARNAPGGEAAGAMPSAKSSRRAATIDPGELSEAIRRTGEKGAAVVVDRSRVEVLDTLRAEGLDVTPVLVTSRYTVARAGQSPAGRNPPN